METERNVSQYVLEARIRQQRGPLHSTGFLFEMPVGDNNSDEDHGKIRRVEL